MNKKEKSKFVRTIVETSKTNKIWFTCIVLILIAILTFTLCVDDTNNSHGIECAEPHDAGLSEDIVVTEPYVEEVEIVETTAPTEIVEETIYISKPILWDENVSLEREYHEPDKELMGYALYTPTNIQEGQKLPLLIWFHGSGEKDVSEATFFNAGLPQALSYMDVTPNAFILCPQLKGYTYNVGQWCDERVLENVVKLIDYVVESNPAIDTENISISGHSLGGAGALYMTHHMTNITKCASLSPYDTHTETLRMDVEDVKMFVGTESCGEDAYSIRMANYINSLYGYEIIRFYNGHGDLPYAVFMNGEETGYSDILTWLLAD